MRIKKLVLFCTLCLALSFLGSTGLMLAGCSNGCGAEHEWVDATCTAPRTCLTCGEIKGEALGHTWDQEVCGHAKTCLTCGAEEAFDHVVVVTEGYAATCETDGLTEGAYCSACNAVITEQEVIPALGHNYILTITEATCIAPEIHTYECANCHDSYSEEVGEIGGHDIEGVKPMQFTIVEACVLVSSYRCKNCSEVITQSQPYHTYRLTSTIEPSCAGDGVEIYNCRYCKDEKREIIPAGVVEHSWDNGTITKEASCIEAGELTYTCSVCSCTKVEAITSAGHSYKDTVVEPTCVQKGYTLHECVNGCGSSYIDNEVDPIDHEWSGEATCESGASCLNCGATQPALGHNYVLTVTEATCEEPEIHTYECANCHDSYSEEVGVALGHDIEGRNPSFEVSGSDCFKIFIYICKTCRGSVNVVVPDHKYQLVSETAATCKTDGVKIFKCRYCDEGTQEIIPANEAGHSWVEGAVVDNKRVDTCEHCGESKSVTVFSGTETGAVKTDDLKDTEIALDNANMALDQGVIDAIKEQTDGKDISISAGTVDKGELNLSTDQLGQIGDSEVYNFTITDSDNNHVAEFGEDNYITITLPYELKDGENADNIAVWFIAENGELEAIQATYNNGFVTFKTNHFSYYTVTKLTPAERCALYGHLYSEKRVEGDCLNDTYVQKLCIRCHDSVKDIIKEATGHEYEEVITPATCTTQGTAVYSCLNCDHSYTTRINALGHEWVLVESADPSCVASGFARYECANEGCEEGYEIKSAQLKHSLVATEFAATCESAGYVLYTCENCDYSYTTVHSSSLGHAYSHAWSWSDDLSSATVIFTCANDSTHNFTVNATVTSKLVAGACPAGDRTEVKAKATYNGNVYEDLIIVEADSSKHVYDQVKYDENNHWSECVCGLKQNVTAHEYNQSVKTEATCGADGEMLFACECGHSYTEVIPATGNHVYSESVAIEATCGAEGLKVFICECGDSYSEAIPATGNHVYSEEIETEATCAVDGLKVFTCECGDSYSEVIPATGNHVYENDVCVNCGKQYGECTHEPTNEVSVDLEALGACAGSWLKYNTCDCGEFSVLNVNFEESLFDSSSIHITCNNMEEGDEEYTEDENGNQHVKATITCLDCGLAIHAEADYIVDGCLESYVYVLSVEFNGEILLNNGTFTVEDSYHKNTERVKVEFSEYGACGGYFEAERCVNCGEIETVLDVVPSCENMIENREEGTDEDGNPYMIMSQICSDCGLSIVAKMWKEIDGCTTYNNQHGIISVGDTVIYETTMRSGYAQHEWEYEYELVGSTCDGGYKVTEICLVCGEKNTWTGNGHQTTYENIELGEYGACDAHLGIEKCEICGEVVNSDGNINCKLNFTEKNQITDENGVVHDVMKAECAICGLLYEYDAWVESTTCVTVYKMRAVIIVNGETVFDATVKQTEENHQFEYEYVLMGETCEEGYIVRCYCPVCGLSEERKGGGHTRTESTIDLAEYGACGGLLIVEKCDICGKIINMLKGEPECQFDYENPEMSEYTDENGFVHQVATINCLVCGAFISSEQWVENITPCISSENMYGYMQIGDVVIFEQSESYHNTNHQFEREIIFEGESCDDGYVVREYCTVCGMSNEYHGHGHEHDKENHVELSEFGACGGYVDYVDCRICGKILNVHNTEIYCDLSDSGKIEYVDENGYIHNGYWATCSVCGLTAVEEIYQIVEGCIVTEYHVATLQINGETILDLAQEERRENHKFEYTYNMHGESCVDGVEIYVNCLNCDYSSYYGYYSGHYTIAKEYYDLAQFGACYGEARYEECPCGEISRVVHESCAYNGRENTYEDENGVLHNVRLGYCDNCGLRVQTDSYKVKEEGSCNVIIYSSTSITVGANLVCDAQSVQKSQEHNYEVSASLMNGESCDNGVIARYTCVGCGDFYEKEFYHHEMIINEEIDLRKYGATCYAVATLTSCACGMHSNMDMEKVLCEFDCEEHPVWIENALYGSIEGNEHWYDSHAELFTCAVTDPDRCAFKYRVAYYYLLEEDECRAYRYTTWQFGYNEEKDTYLYEITVKSNEWFDCHHYVGESLDSQNGNIRERGRLYTCSLCNSTYKFIDTYEVAVKLDEAGNEWFEEKHIRSEREWVDTRDFVETSYRLEIYTTAYVEYEVDGYTYHESYDNYRYNKRIYRYGGEYWSETYIEKDYQYQGPFGDRGEYYREEFTSSYGEHWLREDSMVWWKGHDYMISSYYNDYREGFWSREDYSYSFEGPCMCTRIRSSSYGEYYEETYEVCRMSHSTIIAPTCTQYGLEGAQCEVCGYIGDNYQLPPHGHTWNYINESLGYACLNCGLQNANGATGDVVMEDLTVQYGNGENYVAGYWTNSYVEFTYYVSLILHTPIDGMDEIPLLEAEVFFLEGLNAIACSKAQVEAIALAYGFTPDMYDVRLSFVPIGADGSFDYAITFNDDVFNSIVSTNSNFPVYVDRGEYYEITISPDESGLWEMMSYANADTYGELCNSNGDVIYSDDDGAGFYNNFRIQYYLEAGETYILRVRWYNSSRIGTINVSIQHVAEKA